MKSVWVVVADSSRARIFQRHAREKLEEITDLIHPESRWKARDITTDLPGRFSAGNAGKHSLDGKTDPKEHERVAFAREVADTLNKARASGQYDHLIVAAPPEFLGLLREHLDMDEDVIERTVAKNLVDANMDTLVKQVL